MSNDLAAPRLSRFTRTVLADYQLQGDGAPIWHVCRGREHERFCEGSAEADLRRKKFVKSLKRCATLEAVALADKLHHCSSERPCASGACPVCGRVMQRHFVQEAERVLAQFRRQDVSIASIVPASARLNLNNATASEWQVARKDFKRKLASTSAEVVLAGADFSVNQSAISTAPVYIQGHFYVFMVGADNAVKNRMRSAFLATADVARPVHFRAWDGDLAAIAYAMKNNFSLRTQTTADRAGRAPHRNTHVRALFGRRLVQLSLLLDKIGLDSRRILLGVKRTRSAGVVRYRVVEEAPS